MDTGSVLAPVAQRVLADDHGRPNLALGVVVVRRDIRVVQEGEQGIAIATQALDQAFRVSVGPRCLDEFVATRVEECSPRGKGLPGESLALGSQPDGVAEEPLELLAECRPPLRAVQFVDLLEFPEQVDKARLAGGTDDDVVEIGRASCRERV